MKKGKFSHDLLLMITFSCILLHTPWHPLQLLQSSQLQSVISQSVSQSARQHQRLLLCIVCVCRIVVVQYVVWSMYSIVEIFFFSLSVFPAFHFSCFSIIFSFSFAGGKSFIKVVYVTYYTDIFFFGGFINKKLHFHFLTLLYSLFPSFPIFFLFLYANNSTNFPFVMCRI